MIDLAIGCIEICAVTSARVDLASNQAELAWLTRYPSPSKVIVDQENKILASGTQKPDPN